MQITSEQLQHLTALHSALSAQPERFSRIVPSEFLEDSAVHIFDFTNKNQELAKLDHSNDESFNNYVFDTLAKTGTKMGAGGYGEDRVLYRRSQLFGDADEPRSVHLAVDLWLPAGTEIFTPLTGKIHSFKDNNSFLDYGPTIIPEHLLDGLRFYTLYGHLSRSSIENLQEGGNVDPGQPIGTIGELEENGQWPPHLHFQVIADMLEKEGDFPGVAKPSEKEYYLSLCPDPNYILQIAGL